MRGPTLIPYAEVVGDSVLHSRSPLIHNFWLKGAGIEAEYRACRVGPRELAAYFEDRRADPSWRGCNVTAPLKESALAFPDRIDCDASKIGAVNCVVPQDGELVGSNSDVDGLAEALGSAVLKGRPVALIGAGGAARAAVHHLARCRPGVIRILARSPDKALTLRELVPGSQRFEVFHIDEAQSAFAAAAAIINASPLGTTGVAAMPEPILYALDAAAGDGVVMDMVYRPLETPLLCAGRERGLVAIDGLAMLVGQAGPAFRLFFGKAPIRERDYELRCHLQASLAGRPVILP